MSTYTVKLDPLRNPEPILADFPHYVEPLPADRRFAAPPLVDDPGGTLAVRAWRWWYNARAIVETENRLDPRATAIVVVHPWGIDDGHGLRTPQPAGVSFFCTEAKNRIALTHMREVLSPFLDRLRDRVALIGYSLPGTEDPIRRLLYASISTPLENLDIEEGERQLRVLLDQWPFTGEPLIPALELSEAAPVSSYFALTPSTETGQRYDRNFRKHLPMPVSAGIGHQPQDVAFYDDEGYAKVRDFLKARGVRHVLLAGYATDMCVISTTCGYRNFSGDFNVFLLGDATLATFPAATTPRFATQVAVANAALTQLVTQVHWVRSPEDRRTAGEKSA